MASEHITGALLEAHQRGEISRELLERRILRHLQSECEGCHQEISRWRRTYTGLWDTSGLLRALAEEEIPPAGDTLEAEKDFETLLSLAAPERKGKVDRALSRFRSPLLARELVQEAIGELAHDVEESSNLVDLALVILEHGRMSSFSREVKAHALAVQAMIAKLQGDLDHASRLFAEARQIAPRHGIVDLVLAGEIDEMEGEFLKDRRELTRAEELLVEAVTRYSMVGDTARQARAHLVLSLVRFHSHRIDEAIGDSKRVLELVPEHKAYGVLAAHNVALFLNESGRPEEAARHLKKYQSRYQDAESVWRNYDLHFHWLAGRISYRLGRYDQAEIHLIRARDGFIERETTYDAILVCLDLALVYDATGRHDDLMEVTRVISGELARESLHEESAVAVTLFLKAAAKRKVSEGLVREISRFLHFSRTDPTLKCEIDL